MHPQYEHSVGHQLYYASQDQKAQNVALLYRLTEMYKSFSFHKKEVHSKTKRQLKCITDKNLQENVGHGEKS